MNLAKLFYLMIKIFAYRVVWQVKSTILKKTAYELERKKFRILLGLHVRKLVLATVTSRCFAHCARQAHEIFQEIEVLKRY